MVWIAIVSLLYLISLGNYLLFHTVVELFSVYVAYVIFLIVWKSRARLENRYLIIIGVAFFFIGSIDFLHTLTFRGMEVLQDFGINLNIQLWIAARYLESISFLIAPLFLMSRENRNFETGNRYAGSLKDSIFAWKVFLVYAVITISCLLSIFFFRNFPTCYVEGSGITPFKILSEYLISFILFCSLIALYVKRDRFESKVFRLLAASIILTAFGELSFALNSHVDEFPNIIGHYFKLLSFYLIYQAVVDVGFEEPCSLLFRELKNREEDFRQIAFCLGDEYNHICRMVGVEKYLTEKRNKNSEEESYREDYHSFVEHFPGVGFQFDMNFTPVFVHGPFEEMTGYKKDDLLSGKVHWIDFIIPEDRALISEKREKIRSNPELIIETEYRILRKNGEIKWVREIVQKFSDKSGDSRKFQGLIYDITERKIAEEVLEKIERIRIKEIHHRIKNNLQVISSLLSLQAEKFEDKEVIEAFRESQHRVTSIAMIHEELHGGESLDSLDFADYMKKLTADLFNSYRVGKDGISLKLYLEKVCLGMDTAIPLGIIVNELVSNSLKHAFSGKNEGEICISLQNGERSEFKDKTSSSDLDLPENNNFHYVLTVADNGKGIPEYIDFRTTDSLGLQLITILVDQIDGRIELKKDQGTEFIIWFND